MSGYDFDLGMSNRAVAAYQAGLRPLSKFEASDFQEIGISKAFATWLAKNGYWRWSEWHHSSNFFNKTYFYDLEDLENLVEEKCDELHKRYRVRQKPLAKEGFPVTGSYTIWGGSMNRRKKIGTKEFTGIKKGDWIHVDGGGKKKASSQHLQWKKVKTEEANQ